jgi:uncharacterized protein YcbK (DUF882 family)
MSGGENDPRGATRRDFLRTASLTLLAMVVPRSTSAMVAPRSTGPTVEFRRLRMVNTHTAERIDVTYQEHGTYLPDALAALDVFLRDFRTGDVHRIDPGVLDLAAGLAAAAGHALGTFEIISGYRSPLTNAMLRQRSSGVAASSMHLQGKAIDLRLPGVPTGRLRDIALGFARGGVGFYEASDFVHVDTGRVRRW